MFLQEPAELQSLRQLSGLIGRNPLLTQASSGNTSMKRDGVLWIKGSGKWLINAEHDDSFFLPVPLTGASEHIPESASIETAMHAVLPHMVVAHVHSVNAIAWAVREDALHCLNHLLAGLAWQWIPYTPSGPYLACRIAEASRRHPATDIFLLGSHGLVVAAASCHAASELLNEVERRLALPVRPHPQPDLPLLDPFLSDHAWSLPAAEVHALATDCSSHAILSAGVLYPCQAIFLPATTPLQPSPGSPSIRLFKDAGVLISNAMTRAEREMLFGLAQVVQRIDAKAPIRYLTRLELDHILNGDAHHYRQVADANAMRRVPQDRLSRHALAAGG